MNDRVGTTSYQGTRALDAPLTHPSRRLQLLALDAWDELFVLRGIEAPATAMPFPGRGWTVRTDQGTTHPSAGAGVGGGETIWRWEIVFDSPLPDDVTRITVSPGLVDDRPAPATTLTIPPASIARPRIAYDRRTADCAFCNPVLRGHVPAPSGPRCPACWAAEEALGHAVHEPDPARPRVVPLGADLGNLAGADIAICSLTSWPAWFELVLGAQGGSLASHQGPNIPGRWDIDDDRGNHYTGITTSWLSGVAHLAYAMCAPALDPRARSLTLTFPDPFGDAGIITTTVTC